MTQCSGKTNLEQTCENRLISFKRLEVNKPGCVVSLVVVKLSTAVMNSEEVAHRKQNSGEEDSNTSRCLGHIQEKMERGLKEVFSLWICCTCSFYIGEYFPCLLCGDRNS